MKRHLAPFILAVMLGAGTVLCASSSDAYAQDMWVKLGRGVNNVLLGWLEILHQPAVIAKTERWPIAIAGGIPKGVLYAVARMGVGAFEVLTFPFEIPKDYAVIMEPDFIIPTA